MAAADFDHLKPMMDQIESESDRAAVVLAASALDNSLLQLLKSYLRPHTGSGEDPFLEGDSPLGTFSARIKAVHRLGLIDDDMASVLNLIRKIRNEFAHEVSAHTLDVSPHRDRVRELLKRFCEAENLIKTVCERQGKTGPGIEFRIAAAIVLMRLDAAIKKTVPLTLEHQHKLLTKGMRAPANTPAAAAKAVAVAKPR